MSVAFADSAARAAELAATVQRAMAGARIACGLPADADPATTSRLRVLAAAALFRGGFMPAKAACRDCGASHPSQLSPSRIADSALTDDMVEQVIAFIRGGEAPQAVPESRPKAAGHTDARIDEARRLYVDQELSLRETGASLTPPLSIEGTRQLLLAGGVAIRPRGHNGARAGEASGERRRGNAPVHANKPKRSTMARFGAADIEPERVQDLKPDHAAVLEGRTLFPGSVVPSQESVRLLVSGHNNTKLGKEVLKGDRAGWPIFQLTLEERATCPTSCAVWAGCYGNAMPFARRHRNDADLMRLLRGEVKATARLYPGGFLVRLHTLGDFFSVEYVLMWAELLATVPQLHVFGYTARREDAPDPETRKIAQAIAILTRAMWGRFAIRTSHAEFGPQRSVVVMKDPELPEVIVCPAQKVKTEACATCGLCWAPSARDKTIAFLKHGMKRGGRRKANPEIRQPDRETSTAPASVNQPPPATKIEKMGAARDERHQALRVEQDARMMSALKRLAGASREVTAGLSTIAEAANIPIGSTLAVLRRLADDSAIEIIHHPRPSGRQPPNTYRLLGGNASTDSAPSPATSLSTSSPEAAKSYAAALTPSPPAPKAFKPRVVTPALGGVERGSSRPVRMKAVSDRIVGWCRAYTARGIAVPYLADLFEVDAEDLGQRLGALA